MNDHRPRWDEDHRPGPRVNPEPGVRPPLGIFSLYGDRELTEKERIMFALWQNWLAFGEIHAIRREDGSVLILSADECRDRHNNA